MKKGSIRRFFSFTLTLSLLSFLLVSSVSALSSTNAHATFWDGGGVYVNGVKLGVISHYTQSTELPTYQGTLYIPLRTACEMLGAEAQWQDDPAALLLNRDKTPYFRDFHTYTRGELSDEEFEVESKQFKQDVENGIEVTLRKDVTVLLDGKPWTFSNVRGETVYPITFRDVTYLPVRDVGQKCGKTVIYLPDDPIEFTTSELQGLQELNAPYKSLGPAAIVMLIDPPTQSQIESVRDYLKQAEALYQKAVNAAVELPDLNHCTKEQVVTQLKLIVQYSIQLRQLPKPDAPFSAWQVQMIRSRAGLVIFYVESYLNDIAEGYPFQNFHRCIKTGDIPRYLYDLRAELMEGYRMLDAVSYSMERK